MFIHILFVLGIVLKRFRTDYINRIISNISIVVCESYMFLKIDFTSIQLIIIGLIMGLIQAFILISGSMYCLYRYDNKGL